MHLADQATPTELRLRGVGGKTFIGPADGDPAGAQDREVVLFDGRILILRWLDSEGRRLGARGIAAMPIASAGLGLAINDRLQRAAAPRPKPRTVTDVTAALLQILGRERG